MKNLPQGTLIEFVVNGQLRRARTVSRMWRNGRHYSYTLLPADGWSVPERIVRPVLPEAE